MVEFDDMCIRFNTKSVIHLLTYLRMMINRHCQRFVVGPFLSVIFDRITDESTFYRIHCLRNDLYCVERDVKLPYFTNHTIPVRH